MKTLLALFHNQIVQVLPDAVAVQGLLETMTGQGWQPLAEVYAATLPEADLLVALPGAELLAGEVARMRGIPLLLAHQLPAAELESVAPTAREALMITAHLQDGTAERKAAQQLEQLGLEVVAVAAAVERTNMGARRDLNDLGIRVLAAVQLADTPDGLILERRAPNRWTIPARSV